MPSPTSSTRPTSRSTIWPRYCSISLVRTEAISPVLNLMTASLDQLVPQIEKAGAYRAVVHPVADLHHQPAEQVRLDPHVQERLAVVEVVQFLPQSCLLVLRQRHGAAD